jgi:uncharacterized OB-fold protein
VIAVADEQKRMYIAIESGETAQPFRWSAGTYGSKFLTEIRDNKQFWGIKCPRCGKVYVPIRGVCGPCYTEMTELVPVSDEGTLITFSVVSFGFVDPSTGLQRPVPYGYAVIQLDGADSYLIHFIDETDPEKMKAGMRVKAVFEEDGKRTGSMMDIKHFSLVRE